MTPMTHLPQALPIAAGPLRLNLDETERSELGLLADSLAMVEPRLIDDLKWLEEARSLSCRLPVRLREVIRRYRHDPAEDGILILGNLPVDEHRLPDTPTVPESVERIAAAPSSLATLIGLQLGEIIAYRQEKSGALVQNVVPVPGREFSQSNAGSVPLELHVENAFHPYRPDYVGLLCLRNDHTKTAGTLVSSIRRALQLLSEDDKAVLNQPRFVTAPPPSFHAGDATPVHAVLEGDLADPNVQVDFSATSALDDVAKLAMERLRDAFLEVSTSLVLQSGEMAFVDNRVAIHGRTAFTPRYDGRDRWLHRTFVHLDNRRSRSHRVGNGAVLV
ncbi:TauD/TfdA family dioxygenase [Streptomyces sp. NPDC046557]|uniref:TauD/TfdA family dioxygenase n=1 Tax=Streptomyces sp. NPDC046557 TaxID=3155372 RepID=UPI0033DD4681